MGAIATDNHAAKKAFIVSNRKMRACDREDTSASFRLDYVQCSRVMFMKSHLPQSAIPCEGFDCHLFKHLSRIMIQQEQSILARLRQRGCPKLNLSFRDKHLSRTDDSIQNRMPFCVSPVNKKHLSAKSYLKSKSMSDILIVSLLCCIVRSPTRT